MTRFSISLHVFDRLETFHSWYFLAFCRNAKENSWMPLFLVDFKHRRAQFLILFRYPTFPWNKLYHVRRQKRWHNTNISFAFCASSTRWKAVSKGLDASFFPRKVFFLSFYSYYLFYHIYTIVRSLFAKSCEDFRYALL